MKKVIVQFDESTSQFYGLDGSFMYAFSLLPGQVEDYKPIDVLKLASLGYSADDMIKLKVNNVI